MLVAWERLNEAALSESVPLVLKSQNSLISSLGRAPFKGVVSMFYCVHVHLRHLRLTQDNTRTILSHGFVGIRQYGGLSITLE